MTRKAILIFMFLFLYVSIWSKLLLCQKNGEDVILGKYKIYTSEILGGDITYFVHLPNRYEKSVKHYPVLYLLNAQMVSTVANAVATVSRLDFELIPEMIITGICNTGLAGNYFPQRPDGKEGGAAQFLSFLTQEFIPFMNETYRTADFRILMGQSNTGLFSVYAYLTSPEAFQACIAASPSLGWCLDFMIQEAQPAITEKRSSASLLYMSYGGRDYKELVIDPVVTFKGMLDEKASESFNWRIEHLENDGHVPIATLNNGLLTLFSDYFADDELRSQGLRAVDAHYERLSQKYGFTLQTPEEVIFNICYQKKQSKEYEEAIRIFDVLLQRHPYSVRGHFYLGETYREKGDLDKARGCYLKTLEIDPDFEAAQRRLDLIRKNEESRYFDHRLPGLVPEPFGRGILNTDDHWPHSAPIFMKDSQEVYFSVFYQDDLSKPKDILFCRLEDGVWSNPMLAPFSSPFGDDCPMLSPNGKSLYFASDRPSQQNPRGGKYDIWFVERVKGIWTAPQNLGRSIETKAIHLYSPVITNSGNLYFSGNNKVLSQNHDIYCAEYVDGSYQTAKRLGSPINSSLHESWFFVAPDESYMIFFSGAQGRDSGLNISFRREDGTWTERKSMGDIVNSVGVRMPALSPDGNFLFFQGEEGCWWMDSKIIDYLRTEDLDFTTELAFIVEEQGVDAAVSKFEELKKLHGEYFNLDEKLLNRKGYKLLHCKKIQQAISLFNLNAALFPRSFNVFDSLGEAYLKAGQKEQAVKCYQKSLQINPENDNARKMLKMLKNGIKENSDEGSTG